MNDLKTPTMLAPTNETDPPPKEAAPSAVCLAVLILEDSDVDAELTSRELKREGIQFRSELARNRAEFEAKLEGSQPDVILSDYDVPGMNGFEALDLARAHRPDTPFIYLSGTMDDGLAVDSLHRGATDYVLKSNLGRLGPAVRRAMSELREREARHWTAGRLWESESIYESLVENIPLSILREDSQGRITFANERFCAFVDQPIDEVIGARMEDFVTEKTARAIQHERHEAAAGHSTGKRVEPFVVRDGEARMIEIVRIPLTDSDGEQNGRQVMFWDVTEQLAQQDSLEEQARLLDMAPVAIAVINGSGTVSYWNQGAELIHGVPAREAVGQRLSALIEFGAGNFDLALGTVCDEGGHEFEFTVDDEDGKPRYLHSRWKLTTSRDGHESRVIVMNTDLSELKRLEQQFFRSQRMESIGTLSCGVAHDLNNILSPIMMAADLMKAQSADKVVHKNCATIQDSAKRGAGIVRQLLTFGRGVSGDPVAIEARLIIAELTRMARGTFPKSVTVRNQLTDGLWTVMGDATQIHQVFLNLFVNARDAMPEGGEITVTGENFEVTDEFARFHAHSKPGPHLLLTVSDTGVGIPEDVREKIFDPFFTTKADGKGTGLGLATTLGIVENHGGFVTVYSQPGKGASFNIFLPAEPGQAAADADSHTVFLTRAHGQTVLVVDDEERFTALLSAFLTNQGYQTIVAGSGVEALAIFQQRSSEISLIVTDVDMPQMSGFKFAKTIRENRPDIPIVVASGLGIEEQIEKFETELGITDFLFKPFDSKTLLSVIQRARLAKRSTSEDDRF